MGRSSGRGEIRKNAPTTINQERRGRRRKVRIKRAGYFFNTLRGGNPEKEKGAPPRPFFGREKT